MIRESGKREMIQLLDLVKSDVRTTTGHNLRTIMLKAGKNSINQLDVGMADFKYNEAPDDEAWRIALLREVVELRYGDLEVSGISVEELMEIQECICTQ